MKKTLLFIILVSFFQIAKAQLLPPEKGMHIEHTSYNEAFEKARKENKFFFIDCYTTWCGPCKMMAANTFTADTVGLLFNNFCVNYKQDMEHNEGPQLAQSLRVEAYPTFFFIKPNGDIAFRAMGYMPPKNFIETALQAFGAEANLDSLLNRYNKGNKTAHNLQSIMVLMLLQHKDYSKYLNDYFQAQPQNTWNSYENFEVIKNYSLDITSPEIEYLLKNKIDFEKLRGKENVDEVLKRIATANLKSTEKKKVKAAQKVIDELNKK